MITVNQWEAESDQQAPRVCSHVSTEKKDICSARVWMHVGRHGRALLLWIAVFAMGHVAHAQLVPIPFIANAVGRGPGSGTVVCAAAVDSIGDGCPAGYRG